MLELENISLSANARRAREDEEKSWLLREISARIPQGHLCAILGPSGCGKSTLLKVIAGVREPDEGAVQWQGRNLAEEQDLDPNEIGYVPQFSIAYDLLTVAESIETALRLRVGGLNDEELSRRVGHIMSDVGLSEIADRRVAVLSGGQKRRLALGLEMVSSPVLLLCDEVTSGLDPKAEDEIVRLLQKLSREKNRTVLSVTHSLRHLALHDSVLVLHSGRLAYHGEPELLFHYFHAKDPEELFPMLAERSPDEWDASWKKHRQVYYTSMHDTVEISLPVKKTRDEHLFSKPQKKTAKRIATALGEMEQSKAAEPKKTVRLMEQERFETKGEQFVGPTFFAQFATLLARRWKLFLRDRGQLGLQLALLFGFPFLVVIFALDGLPQIQNLTSNLSANAVQQMLESAAFSLQATRVAGLVSGLVMFQVVLLTLMGSNNSAREIAGERAIFEKEKFAGVRASSYIASKAVFLSALVFAQSVWMAVFVNTICRFPGDLLAQIGILVLVNAAMSAICLGISSMMKTAEQASLVSVYLVGFQLPLSGAVLALPRAIGWATRPFIAAYWGWSGFLQTMRDTRFYDVVQSVSQTELLALALCCWVLCSHVAVGLVLAYLGCKRSQWE